MKKIIKIVFSLSLVFYLFALVVLLFLGTRGYIWADMTLIEYIKSSSNLIPFKTISTYTNAIFNGSMNMDIPIKNLAGNLIMFLPMGIYLPYFIKRLNKASGLSITMIILLFVIEVIQLVTRRGSFDIDDFILNLLGALIGFGLWKMKFVQKLLKYNRGNSSFANKRM
ncbi:glycopeptide antibiotics resistance protein [Neobacillus niacini]|jgi:glycopeptide antibiotics resistance protein|uniref:VanZ family protein n=1 Tax=Neobacillus driksii TaxID=3035913 RepID=UPI00278A106B|nr:VanZ family protein [Neobacillus niacini]MDQ0971459.1 glycopeptide antibiotics resistance protein [Neobacillus niacini]